MFLQWQVWQHKVSSLLTNQALLEAQKFLLQERRLDAQSARELIAAAEAIGWSKVCPVLRKMGDVTRFEDLGRDVVVLEVLDAFHAVEVLLGEWLAKFDLDYVLPRLDIFV